MAVQEHETQILSTRLEWNISKFYEIPVYAEVKSSEFIFGTDHKIWLSVFRKRTGVDRFYINSVSPITPGVSIHCLLSFVDRDGHERLTEKKVVTFKQGGVYECIKELDTEREGDDLLVKNALIVGCTLYELEDTTQKETSSFTDLSSDFTTVLENVIFSDVVLKVGKESIPAHRVILAARSKVFAAMLEHNMEEKNSGSVSIDDIEPSIVKILLHFVYSGAMPEVCIENIYELYAAADKYALLGLKNMCVQRMLETLSEANAFSYLLAADRHADKKLKEGVIDFFLNHRNILLSDQWQEFCKDNSVLAVEVLNEFVKLKLTDPADAIDQNN